MTQDDDGKVPLFLGPLCAALSCWVGGLTGFGDAITLHIIWNIAGVFGVVSTSRRDVLAKAVTITAVMNLSNLPLSLFVARHRLRYMVPFAAAGACFGIPMVFVGTQLLFFADLTALKTFVGLFFLCFAVGRLTNDVIGVSKQKLRDILSSSFSTLPPPGVVVDESALSVSPPLDTSSILPHLNADGGNSVHILPLSAPCSIHEPASPLGVTMKETGNEGEADEQEKQPKESHQSTVLNLPPEHSTSLSSSDNSNSLFSKLISLLGPSPSSVYSTQTALLFCMAAGVGAGLLNGLLGTGGPPQMIAYSLLAFDKDTIRAMSSLYGAFELPLRCYLMFAGEGNVFKKEDLPEYVLVAVGSWIGFGIGTYGRRYVDTSAVVRILLCLVFASSGILLGALENAQIASVYIVGGLSWILFLVTLWYKPLWCKGLLRTCDSVKKTCAATFVRNRRR